MRARWLESYVEQLVTRDAELLDSGRDFDLLRRYLEAIRLCSAGATAHKTLYEGAGNNRRTAAAYDQLLKNLLVLDHVPATPSTGSSRSVCCAGRTPAAATVCSKRPTCWSWSPTRSAAWPAATAGRPPIAREAACRDSERRTVLVAYTPTQQPTRGVIRDVDIPAVVAHRIRRPAPSGLCVVPGSLPVLSFGDPDVAVVATLSLNPSCREFQSQRGEWLLGDQRRLASLVALGVEDPRDLTDAQVAQVVADSRGYFTGPNWYKAWFHWLESLLQGSGAGSYHDGSACHLDLVQWATKPAQGELSRAVWERLVEHDRDFLRWQLRHSNVKLVLCNGASIVAQVQRAGLVTGFAEDVLTYRTAGGQGRMRVFRAVAEGVVFLGWNRPVASALSSDGRERMKCWLARSIPGPQTHRGVTRHKRHDGATTPMDLTDGHVPVGRC